MIMHQLWMYDIDQSGKLIQYSFQQELKTLEWAHHDWRRLGSFTQLFFDNLSTLLEIPVCHSEHL
jgi:hypothetical protein